MADQVQAGGGEGIAAIDAGDASPTLPANSPRRYRPGTGSLMALFITAVIVVATGIVVFGGRAQMITYPAGSAEAALQGFLRASYQEDYDAAYTYLSASVRAKTALSSYRSYCCAAAGPETVRIDRVSGTGTQRSIFLAVDTYYGEGSEPYSRNVMVPMVQEEGEWHINQLMHGLDQYEYPF